MFFVILGHYWPFYPPNSPKNVKKTLEISSFYTSISKLVIIGYTVLEIWHVTNVTVVFHFGNFLPFHPPIPQKMNKMPGDIIILHKCTKNHDYLLYCSWDMGRDRCNCSFSFWAIFCPFTPLTAQKMNIPKKLKKKHLEISSFYTIVPKIMMTGYTVPEIWRTTDVIIFHFGQFFAFLPPPNSPKNDHFKKIKKNPWRYHHFIQLY